MVTLRGRGHSGMTDYPMPGGYGPQSPPRAGRPLEESLEALAMGMFGTPWRATDTLLSMSPIVGDVYGAGRDIYDFATGETDFNSANLAIAGLGLLPFIPGGHAWRQGDAEALRGADTPDQAVAPIPGWDKAEPAAEELTPKREVEYRGWTAIPENPPEGERYRIISPRGRTEFIHSLRTPLGAPVLDFTPEGRSRLQQEHAELLFGERVQRAEPHTVTPDDSPASMGALAAALTDRFGFFPGGSNSLGYYTSSKPPIYNDPVGMLATPPTTIALNSNTPAFMSPFVAAHESGHALTGFRNAGNADPTFFKEILMPTVGWRPEEYDKLIVPELLRTSYDQRGWLWDERFTPQELDDLMDELVGPQFRLETQRTVAPKRVYMLDDKELFGDTLGAISLYGDRISHTIPNLSRLLKAWWKADPELRRIIDFSKLAPGILPFFLAAKALAPEEDSPEDIVNG